MDKVEAFLQADIILQRAKAKALSVGFTSASEGNIQVNGDSASVIFTLNFKPEPANETVPTPQSPS